MHATEGWFGVMRINAFTAKLNEARLLGVVAALGQQSQPPIAQSIVREATKRGLILPVIQDFTSITGKSVSATVGDKAVVVVSLGYLADKGINPPHRHYQPGRFWPGHVPQNDPEPVLGHGLYHHCHTAGGAAVGPLTCFADAGILSGFLPPRKPGSTRLRLALVQPTSGAGS